MNFGDILNRPGAQGAVFPFAKFLGLGRKAKPAGKAAPDPAALAAVASAATNAERERIRAIFAAPAAASNLKLAAVLAFEDLAPAADAIAALDAAFEQKRRRGPSLDERMAAQPQVRLAPDAPGHSPGSPGAMAAQIISSMNKARGPAAA